MTGPEDARFLREALDAVWEHLRGAAEGAPDASLLTKRAMQLLHDDETSEPVVPELPRADRAALAIVFSLQALRDGSSQEVAAAVRLCGKAMKHPTIS